MTLDKNIFLFFAQKCLTSTFKSDIMITANKFKAFTNILYGGKNEKVSITRD